MTHLRKITLEELERRNYTETTTRAYLHTADSPIDSKVVWYAGREAAQHANLQKALDPHTLRHYAAFWTMPHVEVSGANHGHFSNAGAA